MTDTRPAPFFIADSMGLDFLNSIAVPVDVQVEWLASGDDLLAWLRQADLVPFDVLRAFRKSAVPGQLDAIAAQARSLRNWFRPFVDKHMGRSIEPKALRELEPLNRLLARDEEFGQIMIRDRSNDPDHGHELEQGGLPRLVWRLQRRWQSPESLLLP